MHRGQQLMLVGGFGLLVGAALPWVTATGPLGLSMSTAGYEGDGLITGALGVVLVLVGFLSKGKPGRTYSIGGLLLALAALYLVGSVLVNVTGALGEIPADATLDASVGPGIYLSAVGAVLAIVGGALTTPLPADSQTSEPATPAPS